MDHLHFNKNDSVVELERKDVFDDIMHHLLEDELPSLYLNKLSKDNIFKQTPFSMLLRLKDTMQSPKYHAEGNAWNHTLLVVDEAAKVRNLSKDKVVFMCAALLHDIGKPDTTRYQKNRYTAYNHDVVGAKLADDFLNYFHCDKEFIKQVVLLIRWHMHILYVLKEMSFSNIEEMKKQVDIEELALLGLCDRLGRKNVNRIQEEENIRLFLEKCRV